MVNKIQTACVATLSMFIGVTTTILVVQAWDKEQVCSAPQYELTTAERDHLCSQRRVNGES